MPRKKEEGDSASFSFTPPPVVTTEADTVEDFPYTLKLVVLK